jgi:anti-sigma regulatory factor (Ser/Thr protein kinase)
LPLGILNPQHFDDEVTHYHYGNHRCQILLCSDGAVDTADPVSMENGMSSLLKVAHTQNQAERLPGIVSMLEQQLAGKQAHDDIALIMVDCPAEDSEDLNLPEASEMIFQENSAQSAPLTQEQQNLPEQVEWQFSITLTAPQLRQADIVPLLLHVVNQIELDKPKLSGKLFLILSELFNNALDHGLLRLDSTLKNDPHGMDRYFEERSIRLKQLEQGEIKIHLLKTSNVLGPCLKIKVSDTGEGFDFHALQIAALDASTRRHGRGIALVESLSSKLEYADQGRESQVLISLNNAE